MPLTTTDRRFLGAVERLQLYLILLAVVVLIYLVLSPASEIRAATSVTGLALCTMFWLTQRLLTFITVLDAELTRVLRAINRSLTEEQIRKAYSVEG